MNPYNTIYYIPKDKRAEIIPAFRVACDLFKINLDKNLYGGSFNENKGILSIEKYNYQEGLSWLHHDLDFPGKFLFEIITKLQNEYKKKNIFVIYDLRDLAEAIESLKVLMPPPEVELKNNLKIC